jgi:hypothetical protein
MGRDFIDTKPARIIRIDTTVAKIGLFIKNRENI